MDGILLHLLLLMAYVKKYTTTFTPAFDLRCFSTLQSIVRQKD